MIEFVFGVIAGMIITAVLVNIAYRLATRQAEQEVEQLIGQIKTVTANWIKARVEQDNGVFYVYRVDDNTFMAQGSTMAELKDKIEARWKEATVFVTEGDEHVLQSLKNTQTNLEADRV